MSCGLDLHKVERPEEWPKPPKLGPATDWAEDSMHWRGVVLTGKLAHWCYEFDGLPVDETCGEITACYCFDQMHTFSKWTRFFVIHFGKKITSTSDGV